MTRALTIASVFALCMGLPACSALIDTSPYVANRDGGPDSNVSPDAPTSPVVRIVPQAPTGADDLLVEIVTESTDPLAGGTVTYEYRWLVDGSDASISTTTVPADQTDRAEVWSVEVTPVSADGTRRGAPGTASVTIGNSPPTLGSVGLSTYRPIAGETINTFLGPTSDPDGDSVAVSYVWLRNGTPIDGQITNRLDTARVTVAVGDQIAVRATPRDDDLDGAPVTAGPAIVLADTTRWRQLLPQRALTLRSFAAFDPPNNRVLFAYPENEDGTGVRLWECAIDDAVGCRLTQLFPSGAEPPVSFATALYDARNRRILLFGAQHDLDSGTLTSDVYALDVSQRGNEAWSVLSVAGTPPSPRFLSVVAYDEERSRVLLYGGVDLMASTSFNDLWSLDVSAVGSEAWTELTVPLPPAPIVGPGLVIDASRDRALLVGGGEGVSGEPTPTLAIYTLDLNDTSTGLVPSSSTLPRAVLLPTSGVDTANDRALIAFGVGPSDTFFSDAIAIDLGSLTASLVTPTLDAPISGGRGFLAEAPSGELVLFPGAAFIDAEAYLDLYRWSSSDALTAIHRTGVDLPPPLVGALLSGSSNLTLYGGEDPRGVVRAEGWSGTGGRWQLATLLGDAVSGRSPGPRADVNLQAASAFGAEIQFFGGRVDDSGTVSDGQMWVLRDTRWVEQTLAGGETPPLGRAGAAFFVPACGNWRSGYFGGLASGGYLSDTGFLGCNSGDRDCDWTDPVGALTRPPARAFATAARFNNESFVLIYGGEGSGTVFGDLWALTTCGGGDQPWQALSATGTPPLARSRHTMTLVRDDTPGALESLLVFGGTTGWGGAGTPLGDVTRLVRASSSSHRWEEVVVASGPNDDRISPRFGHVATWDDQQRRLIVYGGERRGEVLGDAWELRIRP